MALGKTRAPAARDALQKVTQDKEALVRNAVSRALRELGAGSSASTASSGGGGGGGGSGGSTGS